MFWIIFPFFLLIMLVIFFLEIGKSEKLMLKISGNELLDKKVWKW